MKTLLISWSIGAEEAQYVLREQAIRDGTKEESVVHVQLPPGSYQIYEYSPIQPRFDPMISGHERK